MVLLLPYQKNVYLDERILQFIQENGFPDCQPQDVLVRKYLASRVPIVLKTGTDREENSSWCDQRHYPIVKRMGLSSQDVTFLNVGLKHSMWYNREAMSVYDPTKMLFVGGEGWMYTTKKPYSFLDALMIVIR